MDFFVKCNISLLVTAIDSDSCCVLNQGQDGSVCEICARSHCCRNYSPVEWVYPRLCQRHCQGMTLNIGVNLSHRGYSTPGLVSTWMGGCLRAGKPSARSTL